MGHAFVEAAAERSDGKLPAILVDAPSALADDRNVTPRWSKHPKAHCRLLTTPNLAMNQGRTAVLDVRQVPKVMLDGIVQ